MSEERPPKPGDEPNNLVWFSSEDLQAMASEAQRLVEDPTAIQEVIARRWMEDTELLHAAFRKLMDQVGDAETLKGALQIAMAAMKIHDSKQEMTRPMVRRIMEAWKGKGRLGDKGPNKQIPGHSGSSLRAGRPGRRGEGQPGLDPDPGQGRRAGVVEVGPYGLGTADSGGPGDEAADSQDPGSEGQA